MDFLSLSTVLGPVLETLAKSRFYFFDNFSKRRHETALKIVLAIALVGIIGFNVAMMYPNNEAGILVSLIVYGGAGLTALPLMNELVVESTYPVGEATSTGFAMIMSQVISFFYSVDDTHKAKVPIKLRLLLFQALAAIFVVLSLIPPTGYEPEHSICPENQGQNFFWYMVGLNAIFVLFYPIFIFQYKCDYRRLSATESSRLD